MATVDLDRVFVRSGRAARLRDVTMTIGDGVFAAVVGMSGSGKSSLLRAIAGLDQIASGAIRLDGRDVTRATPGERDVGMVFQTPALIEHLSTRRNVSFPLDIRRVAPAEIRERVDAEVRAMQIEDLMGRNPATLSLGEQQMVQIARALVRVPSVMLLDEPFTSLDDALRRRLRSEISILQAGYGVTTLMATNDADDLLAMASMVAVLDDGVLVQWDATSEVRRAPATLLAAAATGPIALVEMTVLAEQRGFWLVREDPTGGEFVRVRSWSPALGAHVGRRVVMGIRPEDASVSDAGTVPARIERRLPLQVGGVQCTVAGATVTAIASPGVHPSPGDAVRLHIEHHLVFDPRTDAAIT